MENYDALESMGIYPERIQAQADKIFSMVEEIRDICEDNGIEVSFTMGDVYDSVQEYFQNILDMKDAGNVNMTNQIINAWFRAGEQFISEVMEASGIDINADYYPDVNEFLISSGDSENWVQYCRKGDFSEAFADVFSEHGKEILSVEHE